MFSFAETIVGDTTFSDAELEAYLDEALDPLRAGSIERAAREDKRLMQRLAHIIARRDAGVHTLGEIWRRNQVGVPTREDMASYLLGVLSDEHADYIRFRIETLKCRFTLALQQDLQDQQRAPAPSAVQRRSKYFESSAGLLRKRS